MARRLLRLSHGGLVLPTLALVLGAAFTPAQPLPPGAPGTSPSAPGQPLAPRFGAQAEAITVDVVVLDGEGRPVRGLTKDDFTVLEDGRRQVVVGFEAREVAAGDAAAAASRAQGAAAPARAGTSNREVSSGPARVLALLVDDLGISAPLMGQVTAALSGWIGRQAGARDEVTILTTSGDVWWTDTVGRGRDDLLTALGRVRGKGLARTGAESMTDLEAYRIAAFEGTSEAAFNTTAIGATGSSLDQISRPRDVVAGPAGSGVKFLGPSVVERVVERWWNAHYCGPCANPVESPSNCREMFVCRQRVVSQAQAQHQAWTRRAAGVYSAVARLSRSLSGAPGRKSILLVSEELFEDKTLDLPVRDAIAASQRANTVLYFVGARGLASGSANVAESQDPGRPQEIGLVTVEQAVLATGAGESLADETGGVAITTSNDLAAGLERMAADASAYYLLGYQPEKTPDGGWHKLEVKVARPGLTVRARKRYLAAKPEELARLAARERGDERKGGEARNDGKVGTGAKPGEPAVGKRPLAPSLLAGSARSGLPLRLASYLEDTDGHGRARVRVVVEIDNSAVQVDKSTMPWKGALDLTILAASLHGGPAVPVDERLSLELQPGQVDSGWWLVPRELWLPPGVAQVRVLVRDIRSGRTGLVSERVEIPDVDGTYLSTPLITDRTRPADRLGEPARLVPTARRTFGRRRPLVCQFEVFGFGGRSLPGSPQLSAGYVLRRADGQEVGASGQTPIETDGYHAVRRLVLPIEKLEPGSYELEITVRDELASRVLSTRRSFDIEPEASADAVPQVP